MSNNYCEDEEFITIGPFVIVKRECDLSEPCNSKHPVLTKDGSLSDLTALEINRLLSKDGLEHPHFPSEVPTR